MQNDVVTQKLGIYVHIPFCKSKCAYCAFSSVTDLSKQAEYIGVLLNEIERSQFAGMSADTVYFGGGTPSCLYRGALKSVMDKLRKVFDIDSSAEITVEANPESCDDGFIAECSLMGANRISMGLQSSDDGILRGIGRIHGYGDYIDAAERLAGSNINNISSDIILGLPSQDKSDVEKSICTIAKYCTHASVYALSVEEKTPLYASGYRPDDDFVADLYDFACEKLREFGFMRYEVSNFARDGKYSRHNLKYWRFAPYVGFGAAAHGFDGKRNRYIHFDSVTDYINGKQQYVEPQSDKDIFNEYIMLALRTEKGISKDDFESRFDSSYKRNFYERLAKLKESGLIAENGTTVRIPSDKMFVMNGIIEDLMV